MVLGTLVNYVELFAEEAHGFAQVLARSGHLAIERRQLHLVALVVEHDCVFSLHWSAHLLIELRANFYNLLDDGTLLIVREDVHGKFEEAFCKPNESLMVVLRFEHLDDGGKVRRSLHLLNKWLHCSRRQAQVDESVNQVEQFVLQLAGDGMWRHFHNLLQVLVHHILAVAQEELENVELALRHHDVLGELRVHGHGLLDQLFVALILQFE